MAEEPKDKNQDGAASEEAAPKKGKKGILLGGGIVALVASAYVVSLVALPKAPRDQPFEGPYVTALTPGEVQVNLKGDSSKRYMVVTLQAEYDAYAEKYVVDRVADPLYQAKLRDILISLGRQKTREELDDLVGEETFKSEVRDAVDPLLFPIHVGNPKEGFKRDEKSGLVAGPNARFSTMRGGFHSHMLKVDAMRGTVTLDNGQPVSFDGSEQDLVVTNENGLTVYVDVTAIDPDYVGEVPVGTFGRIRQVLFGKFLVQ